MDLDRGFGRLTSDRGQKIPDKDFTYIDVTAIDKELGRVADAKVLSPTEAPSRARKLVNTGDVLYSCVRPYLLNIAVIETEIAPPPIASTAFAVLNGFAWSSPSTFGLFSEVRSWFSVSKRRCAAKLIRHINDADFR